MTANLCRWKFSLSPLLAILLLIYSHAAVALTSPVEWNDDEQKWLSEHPTIRLAVDIDWLPFEFIERDGRYVGMAAEYIALVSQKLGIQFEVEKNKPWSEVVEAVKNHELDMYSCVVSTEQRREYVNFTRPYLSFPMVIVTRDQVAYVNDMKELKGETVAVVRGYATQDLLEKNHPGLKLFLADNEAQALDALSHGKVYAYIGNIATVSHVIRRDGLTNIKISGKTPYRYELSMGVRKDWPELMPILQKALDSITEDEHDQIYQEWIKLRVEQGIDYTLLWQVLAGVFLLILIILIWNRQLSNEIKKRIDAEQLLGSAHQRLEDANKQLLSYVDIVDKYVITSSTDLAGIITYTSDAFCEISGYSRDELIGSSHRILRHRDMPDSIYSDLWSSISQGKVWQGEIKNRKKNGDFYWVLANISPVFDEQGKISGYTAIRQDISDKKRAEELSITDGLTSLYNRRHFNTVFPNELARAERANKKIALMIIDVDYFKPYNDNYGHQQGDVALKAVSSVFKQSLRRAGDFAFRIGGEEFGVIVTVDTREDALSIAENLRDAVEALQIEHRFNQASDYLTVSIGLKTHQVGAKDSAQTELIYRQADDALYQAKENGRNQVVSS